MAYHKGLCNPCCFFRRGDCHNGVNCNYCHGEHTGRTRGGKKWKKIDQMRLHRRFRLLHYFYGVISYLLFLCYTYIYTYIHIYIQKNILQLICTDSHAPICAYMRSCALMHAHEHVGTAALVVFCRSCHWLQVLGCTSCHWLQVLSLVASLGIGCKSCHRLQVL